MESQIKFNQRTARVIDSSAMVLVKFGERSDPNLVQLRIVATNEDAHQTHSMYPSEAIKLAVSLLHNAITLAPGLQEGPFTREAINEMKNAARNIA